MMDESIIEIQKIEFSTQPYDALVEECARKLIVEKPAPFQCKRNKNPDKANKAILDALTGRANLYAIYTKEADDNQWKLRYIGQRKSDGIRERIRNHLIKKNNKTGAKLELVRRLVEKGHEIGVSFLLVNPEPMRLAVEESLIAKFTGEDLADWNQQGRKK